jgi:hypothetical protein
MRHLSLFAAVALNLIAVGSVSAQQPDQAVAQIRPVVGWTMDSLTGIMHPAVLTGQQGQSNAGMIVADAASTVTYTGTVDMTVNIKLVSTLPKGAIIRCGGSAQLEYSITQTAEPILALIGGGSALNSETVEASISGDVATCKFNIPYSWVIPVSNSKQTVSILGIYGAANIAEEIPATTAVPEAVFRSTAVAVGNTSSAPADGVTTSFTANTVL